MEERKDGWLQRREEGWLDRKKDGWIDGWRKKEGRKESKKGRREDGWMDIERKKEQERKKDGWFGLGSSSDDTQQGQFQIFCDHLGMNKMSKVPSSVRILN